MPFAIGRKVDVRQAVVVDIADGNSTTVVVIQVIQNTEERFLLQIIGKSNVRSGGG